MSRIEAVVATANHFIEWLDAQHVHLLIFFTSYILPPPRRRLVQGAADCGAAVKRWGWVFCGRLFWPYCVSFREERKYLKKSVLYERLGRVYLKQGFVYICTVWYCTESNYRVGCECYNISSTCSIKGNKIYKKKEWLGKRIIYH